MIDEPGINFATEFNQFNEDDKNKLKYPSKLLFLASKL